METALRGGKYSLGKDVHPNAEDVPYGFCHWHGGQEAVV